MVEMWVWQRKRPPSGDLGLTDSPHHSGGIEVHLGSPHHSGGIEVHLGSPPTNQLWVVITTLFSAAGTNKSAPAGEIVSLR